MRLAALAILVGLTTAQSAAAQDSLRKVVLHLRWDHQFQFAGFYAADWQGYYRDAGLDVEIRSAFAENGELKSAIDAVSDGTAQFGIGGTDVLTAVDAGQPLTVVMPVLQQSPIAFFALMQSGIHGPADLIGKQVATQGSDGEAYPILHAVLRAEGIDPARMTTVEARESPAILDLLEGNADVASGTVLSVGRWEERLGAKFSVIYPSAYGIDFYGDSVFVRRDFLEKNEDLVRRFVDASARGWQFALTNSFDIANRLSREIRRSLPPDDAWTLNHFQAEQVKRLTRFPDVPLGHNNIERWRSMHSALASAGVVRGRFDERSVYNFAPVPFTLPDWVIPSLLGIFVVISGVLSWLVARLRRLNGVAVRTAEGLRSAEAQSRSFLHESQAIISIRDPNGRYLYCNPAWEAFVGVPAALAKGRRISELSPPPFAQDRIAGDESRHFKTVQDGKPMRYETSILRSDGAQVHVTVNRFPIRDNQGQIVAVGNVLHDITRHRTTERERDLLAAQLESFIEHAPFLMTIRDTEGRYVLCNKRWEEWTGWKQGEVVGKRLDELLVDNKTPLGRYMEADQTDISRCVADGTTFDDERYVPNPTGEAFHMRRLRFPVRNDSGEVVAIGTVMEDRSELHKLNWAKERVESQLKAFIENAPIGVTITDSEGRYVAANPAFYKMTGTVPGAAEHRSLAEIFPPDHAALIARMNKELLETLQPDTREFHVGIAPGRELDVSLTKFPLRDHTGQVTAIGTFATDVSDSVKAKKALQESEARYRNLVEMAPAAILVHHNGVLLYANAIARRWAGIEQDQPAAGMRITDLMHPDHADAVRQQIAGMAGDRDTILRRDFRFRLRDGTEVEASIVSSPIEFDGRPARQLIIQDVSERKRMEAQLVQNAKLATIGELSAGILHELAQPLNIARMAAQGALRRLRRGKDGLENPGTQFELIENQMARMADVIDHMRVFSRTDMPEDQMFDGRGALRSAVQMVKQAFASENITVNLTLPSRRVFLKGRPIALEQVILNLLSNARDAITQTSSGGRIAVSMDVEARDRRVRITVSDSGGGIPDYVLPRLFDPFFTTKPVGRGTGLGLPVCQSLIQAMGGDLRAENKGPGATFTVRLPLQSSETASRDRLEPESEGEVQAVGASRTVLLVDDEPEALHLIADFYEEMGFDVRLASNGEEGLRAFRGEPIDLVITDIRLPVFDGIELAQMIRARDPEVPIIFMTGHLGVTDHIEILGRRENVRIFHKPVDLDQLERATADILANNTKVV